jgi:hypothetical protein
VQAAAVSYQLGSLGWKAFQDLCGTILAEVLGQTFETYGPGRDGGRDGAFRGTWRVGDGAELSGTFTAQCKFTAKDAPLSKALLKEDLLKAALLARRGLADVYILMTNHTVTGDAAAEVEAFVPRFLCSRFCTLRMLAVRCRTSVVRLRSRSRTARCSRG